MDKKLMEIFKQKQICVTNYGESVYGDLFYCDNKNKICISFTPRAGCSISFQQYLDLVGLLKDGLDYDSFIHKYRAEIFLPCVEHIDINNLIQQEFTFIKFTMNPYIRAVSVFRLMTSHNLSFRQYLEQLINNKLDYLNENDKYHYHQQYIDGEEKIITKYIKIDKNETFEIKLSDGTLYNLDVNKYSSCHHGKKTKCSTFCGDLLKNDVNKNLPKSYKYFYDEEIKKMVETYYKKDIEYYGYSIDEDYINVIYDNKYNMSEINTIPDDIIIQYYNEFCNDNADCECSDLDYIKKYLLYIEVDVEKIKNLKLILDDFDYLNYANLNEDIYNSYGYNKKQIIKHYILHGCEENRKYKYENIPEDFNPKVYIELNEDLKHMTELQATNHFENSRHKENRRYKDKNG